MARLRFLSLAPWGFHSLLGRVKRRTLRRNNSLVPVTLTGLHPGMLRAGTSPVPSISLPVTLIPSSHRNGSRIPSKALASKARARQERRADNGALRISPPPPPSRGTRGAVKQHCNSSTRFKNLVFQSRQTQQLTGPLPAQRTQPARGTKSRAEQATSVVKTPRPSPASASVLLLLLVLLSTPEAKHFT